MELKLENGRYVSDTQGRLLRVSGQEELMQRILMKLKARRGGFAPLPDYGSRLYLLGRTRPSERERVAAHYVTEALAGETGLRLEALSLEDTAPGAICLHLTFRHEGEALHVDTLI